MGEQIINYGKEHYYWVLMGGGLLILIGAIRNWKWVVEPTKEDENNGLKYFIIYVFGVEAYRFLMGFCGLALIVLGMIFWYYSEG
uniref:Immunity protein 17 n=1 Tax=Prevotella sp. GTC17260 TaxID=3236796 RepID=A0AB33JI84_9BACT